MSGWTERIGMSNGIPGLHSDYDGSLHPDLFMELVKAGAALTPTDKNYKVYVEAEVEEGAGQMIIAGSSGSPYGDWKHASEIDWSKVDTRGHAGSFAVKWGRKVETRGHYYQIRPRGTKRTDKFYFYHFTPEQREEFVRMYEAGELRLKTPGYFYSGVCRGERVPS